MLDEVMQKPFKSVTEQVSILKSRGLTIKDEKAASRYLLFNNYYNVVNHFGKFFQDGSDCYISGASFDEIRYLFQLDKEIKEAIALRVGKSFITECWWKILPSVASLAVWGVHRFRMATRV